MGFLWGGSLRMGCIIILLQAFCRSLFAEPSSFPLIPFSWPNQNLHAIPRYPRPRRQHQNEPKNQFHRWNFSAVSIERLRGFDWGVLGGGRRMALWLRLMESWVGVRVEGGWYGLRRRIWVVNGEDTWVVVGGWVEGSRGGSSRYRSPGRVVKCMKFPDSRKLKNPVDVRMVWRINLPGKKS